MEEYSFSMNRYKRALCRTHQRSGSMSGTTKGLQDLVRDRHADELIQDVPVLKTIKDWIAADLDTWDKVLNKKEEEGSYIVTFSGEESKNRDSKRGKRKEKT